MDMPIACSLDAVDVRTQVDEWRSLLTQIVTEVERQTSASVTMRLAANTQALAALVELARREAACCQFFRFAVEIDAEGASFTASVPPHAIELLDGFAALASR